MDKARIAGSGVPIPHHAIDDMREATSGLEGILLLLKNVADDGATDTGRPEWWSHRVEAGLLSAAQTCANTITAIVEDAEDRRSQE